MKKTTSVVPRWLDPEEQKTWLSFLLASRLLFAQLERDVQRDAGMPLTYYEVLSVLSGAPDRALRMSDLADTLQVSPSRVSHAVSRLENEGWVRRDLCPSDRRSWFATLTDTGFEVLERSAPSHVESVRLHLFDQLSPTQLCHLRQISENLLGHLATGDEGASAAPPLASSFTGPEEKPSSRKSDSPADPVN